MRSAPLLLVTIAACSGTQPGPKSAPPTASTPSTQPSTPASSAKPPVAKAEPKPPAAKLTIPQARAYMVELVNRDRASMNLPPVQLDLGPPTVAGQAHADDMATLGYLGHWGSDGSVPEQRLTEAGGADMVLENALCFTDEKRRTLDASPLIEASAVESAESMFFNEVPPHDGHRQNILKPFHTHVGIGVAQPVATEKEIPVPCFSQEFVDRYGTYAPLPKKGKAGAKLRVEGQVDVARAPFGGVGVTRLDVPKPLTAAELNLPKRRQYSIPEAQQMYWPAGFKTPIPVERDGARFWIDAPLAGPGLYQISVWAKLPGSTGSYGMVSLRTLRVD